MPDGAHPADICVALPDAPFAGGQIAGKDAGNGRLVD